MLGCTSKQPRSSQGPNTVHQGQWPIEELFVLEISPGTWGQCVCCAHYRRALRETELYCMPPLVLAVTSFGGGAGDAKRALWGLGKVLGQSYWKI